MANEITQKGGSVNSKPGHWERSSLRNKNFLKKGKEKKKENMRRVKQISILLEKFQKMEG